MILLNGMKIFDQFKSTACDHNYLTSIDAKEI